MRGQFFTTVVGNEPLCREHFRLTLSLPTFGPTQPGQFIQIECREPSVGDEGPAELDWRSGDRLQVDDPDLLAPRAMLRRPFSLAGRRDRQGAVELNIIHRVVGVGTDWLARLKVGDSVGILGPLGNSFTLPKPDQTAILVGGGVGIPPMLYLASQLTGRRAVAFAGALTRDLVPLTIIAEPSEALTPTPMLREFAQYGIDSIVTTDDGSLGYRGYVTQALERYLDGAKAQATSAIIYTCGPEPMMKRVAEIAAQRGIECQIAVERAMACGMGTCQSCCIRVLKADPSQPPLAGSDWCYRLACTDGPVFRGRDLLW